MRLEMAEFPVRRLRLGDATRYQDGVLDVDRMSTRTRRDGRATGSAARGGAKCDTSDTRVIDRNVASAALNTLSLSAVTVSGIRSG